MIEKNMKDKELESVFNASKLAAPRPTADLMSRVLSDAMVVQSGFAAPPVPSRRSGIWPELFRVLGGWPAMAGLATATVAGVWLGAFPPDVLPGLTNAYLEPDDAAFLVDTAAGTSFDLTGEAL